MLLLTRWRWRRTTLDCRMTWRGPRPLPPSLGAWTAPTAPPRLRRAAFCRACRLTRMHARPSCARPPVPVGLARADANWHTRRRRTGPGVGGHRSYQFDIVWRKVIWRLFDGTDYVYRSALMVCGSAPTGPKAPHGRGETHAAGVVRADGTCRYRPGCRRCGCRGLLALGRVGASWTMTGWTLASALATPVSERAQHMRTPASLTTGGRPPRARPGNFPYFATRQRWIGRACAARAPRPHGRGAGDAPGATSAAPPGT